jgi:hypothetical protein
MLNKLYFTQQCLFINAIQLLHHVFTFVKIVVIPLIQNFMLTLIKPF